MKKILNPLKMIRDDIKCPTKEDLLEAKELICYVLSDCRYQIKRFLKSKDLSNYGEFNAVSCDAIFNNLYAICRIGSDYNSQIFTIARNYQEIIVDNFWLYDFFLDNPKKAEDLSERFFYFGKKMLIRQIESNLAVMNSDLFFRDLNRTKLEHKKNSLEREIEPYIYWGDKPFQKDNWRAHPKYFSNSKSIQWKKRTETASLRAMNSVNFKNPPFEQNLTLLSSFNHWDPLQIDDHSNTNNEILFCRTLNILLGYAIDLLNIQYKIRENDKNRPPKFVKAVNLIYYSSQ